MKKITVTVGIPVHNEVENIGYLLESIVRQKRTSFKLEKILVVCDGTTDGTDRMVQEKAKKNSIIHLVKDGKRKGKMKRLIEVYEMNKSDYIFVFDGDVVLAKSDVIENMIQHFNNDNIAVVGGNNQPIEPENFTAKLINKWSHVWYIARRDFNRGDNVHNIRGCAMALRGDFAKTIVFPKDVVSDAQYIYFYALSKNAKFSFSKDAIVLYRKPANIEDYFLQTKRSSPEEEKLRLIFGSKIKAKYKIPKNVSIMALFKVFLEDPIFTSMALGFHILSLVIPYNDNRNNNEVLWKVPKSTKKAITSVIL